MKNILNELSFKNIGAMILGSSMRLIKATMDLNKPQLPAIGIALIITLILKLTQRKEG